jgi:hypothetical protein
MRVVNVRSYGGRAGFERSSQNAVYIGRPSVLGNPFVLGRDGDRSTVIEKFRHWLWVQVKQGNVQVLRAIRSLTEHSVLGCWCSPDACHGQVIQACWQWLTCK